VGYAELALPLLPGLLLLAVGGTGVGVSNGWVSSAWLPSGLTTALATLPVYMAVASVAGAGGFLSIMALGGMLGEAVSRATFRDDAALDEAAVAGGHASAPRRRRRLRRRAAAARGPGGSRRCPSRRWPRSGSGPNGTR
jgi:energy-converting hydrogenase Eha subunit H